MNSQDIKGITPLHLAVRTAEDTLSSRAVKSLLLKGARLDIRSNAGKLPIDLVDEMADDGLMLTSLKRELQSILDE